MARAMQRNCLMSKAIGHSSITYSHTTRIVFGYRNELQSLANGRVGSGKTRSWIVTNWQVSPHGDGSHDIMIVNSTLNKSSFMQDGCFIVEPYSNHRTYSRVQ